LGPIPTAGEDRSFAGGLTIRAEKCPNRRGVEEVATNLSRGPCLAWGPFVESLAAEPYDAIWISGGYPGPWHDAATAQRFEPTRLLIVQDLFDSPLLRRADYQLPGAAFAEREGSSVNHADRLQSFGWAVRPPAGVLAEGQLYWRLLRRPGLYAARRVLDEVAHEILYFRAAAGSIPDSGVDLKINLLADT